MGVLGTAHALRCNAAGPFQICFLRAWCRSFDESGEKVGGGGGGGGLMRGIKIPPHDFPLKMQGGLCVRGGVFAGHYGTPCVWLIVQQSQYPEELIQLYIAFKPLHTEMICQIKNAVLNLPSFHHHTKKKQDL